MLKLSEKTQNKFAQGLEMAFGEFRAPVHFSKPDVLATANSPRTAFEVAAPAFTLPAANISFAPAADVA